MSGKKAMKSTSPTVHFTDTATRVKEFKRLIVYEPL